ncbi:MAG TPA: hypothetical protein VKQ30_11750 [Ktedonobacterales bacterium]|nr:hypothetical protein [Ktedonobacterales bacterium]
MLDTLDTLAAAVSRNGGYDFGVAGVRGLPDYKTTSADRTDALGHGDARLALNGAIIC